MSEDSKVVFNLALALRRLLIVTDKRSSAARFAAKVLAEAEGELGK